MIKKHLIVAAMIVASVCSCVVVGKNVHTAFAKEGSNSISQPIVYTLDNKEYTEYTKDFVYDEDALKNDSKHNLAMDLEDDFVYTNTTPVVYALEDETYDSAIDMSKTKIQYLEETRGNYPPTSFWNLANGNDYQYHIPSMSSYLFTNYYFSVNSIDYISMSMGTLNSGGNNFTITCYEVGNPSTAVMGWTGDPQTIQGLGWGPLNPYKTYYFKFEISTGTLYGAGKIYH